MADYEGYCVKCKEKRTFDGHEVTLANGRPAAQRGEISRTHSIFDDERPRVAAAQPSRPSRITPPNRPLAVIVVSWNLP